MRGEGKGDAGAQPALGSPGGAEENESHSRGSCCQGEQLGRVVYLNSKSRKKTVVVKPVQHNLILALLMPC